MFEQSYSEKSSIYCQRLARWPDEKKEKKKKKHSTAE